MLSAVAPPDQAPIELRISFAPAANWPRVQVELANISTTPVWLVAPGDGSDAGWRTPIIEWFLVPLDADAAAAIEAAKSNPPGRCGNMNPIMLADIFTLKPSERRSLTNWVQPRLPGRGAYRLSLRYRNVPSMPWHGEIKDRFDALAMERIKASLPVDVTSNHIDVYFGGYSEDDSGNLTPIIWKTWRSADLGPALPSDVIAPVR
jgi:hypothetical protein